MKRLIFIGLLLSGCSATLQSPFGQHVTVADYQAAEQAKAEQLKQVINQIAILLDKKVDKVVPPAPKK